MSFQDKYTNETENAKKADLTKIVLTDAIYALCETLEHLRAEIRGLK